MSTVVRAPCHNFTDIQSRRFIFSRGKPRVISWLVVPFQIPRSKVYKQWNSSSTLYISEIFLRLEPRLEVSLHPQSSLVQSQVFSFFQSLGIWFPKMSKTVISSSSDSTKKDIDEYYGTTSNSGSSNISHSSEERSIMENIIIKILILKIKSMFFFAS